MLVEQVASGGWLSCTMTRCWQNPDLPHWSVAVQVTTLVPRGNCKGALLVKMTPPQPEDVSVGPPRLTRVAKHKPAFALTVTAPGQAICGGGELVTMTRCWQEFVLPLASVTVQVTKFVPSG